MPGINIFDGPNIGGEDKALLKKGQNVSFETDYDSDKDNAQTAGRSYFMTKPVKKRELIQLLSILLSQV